MTINKVFRGDIGTVFEITLLNNDGPALDISQATKKELAFRKPSGEVVIKPAAFGSDGIDGVLEYVAVADDIDEVGAWQIQAVIEMGGATWSSEIDQFSVYRNL